MKSKNKTQKLEMVWLMPETKKALAYLKIDFKLKTYDAVIQYLLQNEKGGKQ